MTTRRSGGGRPKSSPPGGPAAPPRRLRVAYLGNFVPGHSTENHVAGSLEALGHQVTRIQEGSVAAASVAEAVALVRAELFMWTQTLSLAEAGGSITERAGMLEAIRSTGIPSLGFHLDRWWGLDREHRIHEEPFFRVDLLATADGGHDAAWREAGVNHVWSPPGVYHAEAIDGQPRSIFRSDVAFVGSWDGYGHPEWEPDRMAMLAHLRARYGDRFKMWPPRGSHAIRGADLNSLYASVKVTVGDSCLAGNPARYWSDRVPETTGRGGFIVHPHVEGLSVYHPNVETFPLGDHAHMVELVDSYLADAERREAARQVAAAETRQGNTYRDRLPVLLEQAMAIRPAA
jgi:hypothetical protein